MHASLEDALSLPPFVLAPLTQRAASASPDCMRASSRRASKSTDVHTLAATSVHWPSYDARPSSASSTACSAALFVPIDALAERPASAAPGIDLAPAPPAGPPAQYLTHPWRRPGAFSTLADAQSGPSALERALDGRARGRDSPLLATWAPSSAPSLPRGQSLDALGTRDPRTLVPAVREGATLSPLRVPGTRHARPRHPRRWAAR